MIGFQSKNGDFIDFAKINFKCPFCNKEYIDKDDKYLKKCNKNKKSFTKIKCECKKTFGMTYNMLSEAVSFDL